VCPFQLEFPDRARSFGVSRERHFLLFLPSFSVPSPQVDALFSFPFFPRRRSPRFYDLIRPRLRIPVPLSLFLFPRRRQPAESLPSFSPLSFSSPSFCRIDRGPKRFSDLGALILFFPSFFSGTFILTASDLKKEEKTPSQEDPTASCPLPFFPTSKTRLYRPSFPPQRNKRTCVSALGI